MNKRFENFVREYNGSEKYNIWQCYERFSTAKACAEAECRRKMEKQGGWGFKILSYNSNTFTCGWQTAGKLHIETYRNSYIIPYENLPF